MAIIGEHICEAQRPAALVMPTVQRFGWPIPTVETLPFSPISFGMADFVQFRFPQLHPGSSTARLPALGA